MKGQCSLLYDTDSMLLGGWDRQESSNAGHIQQPLFYSLSTYLLAFYFCFLNTDLVLVKASLELQMYMTLSILTLFLDCTYA